MPPLTVLLQTSRNGKIPIIGDGVTVGIGSDCYPATIIALDMKKGRVTIQYDSHSPAENYDYFSNQVYNYSPNPDGTIEVWSLRKNLKLSKVGSRSVQGWYLSLNGRRCYQDPGF